MIRTVCLLTALLLSTMVFGQGVTINGPEALDVKEADLFFVEGLTIEEFKQCAVHVRPEINKPQVLVLQTVNNLPVLYVKGRSAGTFDLILDVNIPNKYELVFHALVIGGGGDDPPNPPDPPLPPNQKWRVAIVFERTKLDNLMKGQQQLIGSLTFRDKLKAAGHLLVPGGVVDQHTKDADGKTPKDLAPYLDAVEGDPLPRICLEPIGGGDVLDFPLPSSEAAVFELLEKGKN